MVGHDAAPHLDLPETAIIRSDHHVGREHEFDADGEADALHGHDDRFRPQGRSQVEGIDRTLRSQMPAGLEPGGELIELQARREMCAERMKDADSDLGLALHPIEGVPELDHHALAEAVAFRHPIDADQQQRPASLDDDAPLGRRNLAHGFAPDETRRKSGSRFSSRDDNPSRNSRVFELRTKLSRSASS